MATGLFLSLAFGGYAFATGLQTQGVGQHANAYGVSTSSVTNFPSAPTVNVGAPWSWTTACNQSWTGTTGAQFVQGTWEHFVIGINGTTPSCSSTHFAEIWQFAGSTSSMSAEVDTFAFYATWTGGNGQSYSSTTSFGINVPGVTNNGAGVVLAVDFGQANPPAQIASLSVVVS